jgi:hypothetical protein
MTRGSSGNVVGAGLINATTGAAFAGTVTVYVTLDGGTQAIGTVGSGLATAEGHGYYTYRPSAAECNGELIAFTFIGTGAIPATVQFLTDPVPSLTPTTGAAATGAVAALDLITDAFAELNVFLPGESVPNGDAQAGLRSLNGLLGSWAQQSLTIPTSSRLLFDLVADQGSPTTPYTIGSGGDFDTPRPANANALMGAALWITASDFETPLEVMGMTEWQFIPNKIFTATLPTTVIYNPTFTSGLGAIYLWPQATDTSNQLVLYLNAPLATFANLTTSYQLPPGYRDALMYGLAARLSAPYGRPVSPELQAQAARSVSLLKRGNAQLGNAENWFGGVTRYDILSGDVVRR